MKIIVKNIVLFSAILFSILLISCTNVGNRRPSSLKKVVKTIHKTENKIEDFCKDNKETVERYKKYLDPNYHWHQDPKIEARQKGEIRRFVEQYEKMCGKDT